jgi:7-alpha-hydroxysteroid dehydrogenase
MILDSFRVTDKVAIVTGAGHGIGRAIAVALAEAGAHVVSAARTQKDIDETTRLVEATGRKGLAVPCDVLDTAQLENLVRLTLDRFGRIDILVNNAGGMIPRPSLSLSERAFEKIVRFNLTSPFLMTKLVVPHMVKIAGSGVVVNISSGASQTVVGGLMPYGAAKAGLDQMTHMLGAEFAPEVRVNSIVVGQIDTPGASSVISEELKQRAAQNIPMRRMGQSSDIAACALYLASPASSWVTSRSIARERRCRQPAALVRSPLCASGVRNGGPLTDASISRTCSSRFTGTNADVAAHPRHRRVGAHAMFGRISAQC